jgi:hypothetical protein
MRTDEIARQDFGHSPERERIERKESLNDSDKFVAQSVLLQMIYLQAGGDRLVLFAP